VKAHQVNLFLADFSHLKPLCDSVNDEFEDFSFYEVLFNGECKSNNDFKACPSGQELLTNAFGIGECGCMEGFLPYIEKNESFSCYQEFLQGPCSEGQQYIKVGKS